MEAISRVRVHTETRVRRLGFDALIFHHIGCDVMSITPLAHLDSDTRTVKTSGAHWLEDVNEKYIFDDNAHIVMVISKGFWE